MRPPRISRLEARIRDNLVFFGPGLLLAITAAGEAGISEALEIGAHFGTKLVWVVIATLIFKFAFTTGIARYTLATGKTIFEGVSELPGPKNWGSYFTIICYLIEAMSLGAMCLFAATFLDYLFPGLYQPLLISLCILLLAILVLRTRIYKHFELIMAVIVIGLAIVMVLILSNFSFSFENIAMGLIPSIPPGSEMSILAIIGVVGSGLNLMLYSVWLEKSIRYNDDHSKDRCVLHNEAFFKKYVKSIRFDVLFGFVIVAIITLAFMAVGYVAFEFSFLPHGTELNLDTILAMTTNLIITIPFGPQIALIVLSLIFFGSITVGVDARASAITKIIKNLRAKAGRPVKNSSITYNFCLLIFVAIMAIAIGINNPTETIRIISVMCALMFGIFGFILLYLNSKLPEYARGNRLWMLFIAVGSILAIVISLYLEQSLITTGFPIIKNLIICLIGVYVFTKTSMFKRFINGVATYSDKFWLIFLFGALSILGAVWGTTSALPTTNGTIIEFPVNFSDIGPIFAGFIGGPIPGLITAIVGGIFRIAWTGGEVALPCIISSIVAGLAAGIAIRVWKGKLTYLRAGLLGAVLEIVYLFSILPTYLLASDITSVKDAFTLINHISLPIVITTVVGILFFVYFIRKRAENGIQEPMNRSNGPITYVKKETDNQEEKK